MLRKDEFRSRGFGKQHGEMLPLGVGVSSRRRVSTFFLDLFIPNLFLKRCYSSFPQRTYAKRSAARNRKSGPGTTSI